MSEKVSIHWFRQDLRLSDNPALSMAATHENLLPIFILDDHNSGIDSMGGASCWWLHHSLTALNASLGNGLLVYRGDPQGILEALMDRFDVEAIYWNRCYEPWQVSRDTQIKKQLTNKGVVVRTFNASLLWEPWLIKKDDGRPYKVFTPFYRKGCLNAQAPRIPLTKPERFHCVEDQEHIGIAALDLLPKSAWSQKLEAHWGIGEDSAHKRLVTFMDEGLCSYKDGRNFPAKPYVSRLSPHLHFGEVSPNQLWHAVRSMGDDSHIEHFCSELGWREFSYSQLYHNPDLPLKNLQTKFDGFPWNNNPVHLKAWQRGQTGIPMVDAGMRELWQTGYMHNRVRMIVGSFLVKNLREHWHHGRSWFADTLVDADLANNSASWQWIAGCGADAAPYFRIFNPVAQGQKFDPEGDYVRQYVPEIAGLPNACLFNPWEASEATLKAAGVELGVTYPNPIVGLKQSREQALSAFQSLKKDGNE